MTAHSKKIDKIREKMAKNQEAAEKEADVLYQRMGDRWYAFSIVDDEVFMGEVPEDAIHLAKSEAKN
ncbi:MAG: hypothetical protein AB7P04_12615 [Bacteriovoracia bacterium]